MKRKNLLTGLMVLLLTVPLWAELTVREIVDRVDEVVNVPQSYMLYEQVVVTANKVKTDYTVETYAKNGDEKQLTRYIKPSKVKGTSFLMLDHGDNIWAFFSSSGRVRLIARHMKKQKMMGSEFTYEDMAMTSIKRNYSVTLMGEQRVQRRACYKLELIPRGESSYGKLIAFADKENFVIMQLDYYRKGENKPHKRMVQGKVKVVDGTPTPHLIVMKNLENEAQTAIKVLKVDYRIELDDSQFTTTALQK